MESSELTQIIETLEGEVQRLKAYQQNLAESAADDLRKKNEAIKKSVVDHSTLSFEVRKRIAEEILKEKRADVPGSEN